VNNHLRKKNSKIENILSDFSDGVFLIKLLESLYNEHLGRYNYNPILRVQKVENLNKALDYLKERGIYLTNIGAEDILDLNSKLTLGLVWMLILNSSIDGISNEGLSAKDALLVWCQRKTKGYKDVNIKDFTSSWQDGLAFCALIHKHRPDLLDYSKLDKNDPIYNTNLAFDIAEKYIGIPKLLEAEDICLVPKPDEKSIITYVAQYYHAFSSQNKLETAGRRLIKLSEVLEYVYRLKSDYESRAQSLISEASELTSLLSTQSFGNLSLKELNNLLNTFNTLKKSRMRHILTEKEDLFVLIESIQIKLETYQLPNYQPPDSLLPSVLESKWKILSSTIDTYKHNLLLEINKVKSMMCKQFAAESNVIKAIIDSTKSDKKVEEPLDQQLVSLRTHLNVLIELKERLPEFQELESRLLASNIDLVDISNYSYEDLQFEYQLTHNCLSEKIKLLENQLVLRNSNSLTPEQLDEFESVFRQFDRQNENMLADDEFRAALETLDLSYSNEEYEELFGYLTSQNNVPKITFEQYIRFLMAISEDQNNPSQVYDSFLAISNGKDYITKDDLILSGLTPEQTEALALAMPKVDEAGEMLDFNTFVDIFFKN
ncbi:hypothetical protein BB560_002908, partial [Smittium megazygosporum]